MAVRIGRRGLHAISVSALVLVAGALPSAARQAPGARPAKAATTSSVIAAARRAIAKQTGVHVVAVGKAGSSPAVHRVIADLGVHDGVETIFDGTARVTVRVTPTHAYISGNTSGLEVIVGLKAAAVTKTGKDWLSVKVGTTQYSGLEPGITISSVSSVLPKASGTTLATRDVSATKTRKATKLYVLGWTEKATGSSPKASVTLSVAAMGAELPIEEVMTSSGAYRESVSFSKWGEAVHVSAPAARSTIPYTKVAG
jgi:hypothetical protein